MIDDKDKQSVTISDAIRLNRLGIFERSIHAGFKHQHRAIKFKQLCATCMNNQQVEPTDVTGRRDKLSDKDFSI
jgi:hypothetical protein